jgi:hypothetical protein
MFKTKEYNNLSKHKIRSDLLELLTNCHKIEKRDCFYIYENKNDYYVYCFDFLKEHDLLELVENRFRLQKIKRFENV